MAPLSTHIGLGDQSSGVLRMTRTEAESRFARLGILVLRSRRVGSRTRLGGSITRHFVTASQTVLRRSTFVLFRRHGGVRAGAGRLLQIFGETALLAASADADGRRGLLVALDGLTKRSGQRVGVGTGRGVRVALVVPVAESHARTSGVDLVRALGGVVLTRPRRLVQVVVLRPTVDGELRRAFRSLVGELRVRIVARARTAVRVEAGVARAE